MWSIYKKDLSQFFSGSVGYLILILFTTVNGLLLFVMHDFNILELGYADLNPYFDLAPWIILLLTSALSIRCFTDEFRTGSIDILKSLPLSVRDMVLGKFLFVTTTVLIALLPSAVYVFTIHSLSANGQVDMGAIVGSTIGLLLMSFAFSAIGLLASSLSQHMIGTFFMALFACLLLFYGFNALARMPFFQGGGDYYLEMAGVDFHYRSMSRGVIDSRDVLYFAGLILTALWYTVIRIKKVYI